MPKRRKLTHSPTVSTRPSPSPSPPPVHTPYIRPSLFGDGVIAVPAGNYTRSKKNPVRFFLLTKRQGAQGRTPAPQTHTASRTTLHGMNYVQLATAPTADTPGACLYVHHDNRRYLFGHVAEGTQRAFIQQKLALGRAEQIFLSGPVGWQTAGGLLGLILTVAEAVSSAGEAVRKSGGSSKKQAGKPEEPTIKGLHIHGGQNLTQLLATARRFVFRKGLPILPHEVRAETRRTEAAGDDSEDSVRTADWADDNMKVWYVPVYAEGAVPQKRSRDEEEEDAAGRQVLEAVVGHMFDSTWTMDALVETTLYAAQLPAKLFVRDAAGHLQAYTGPVPGDEGFDTATTADIPVLVRQPWPGSLVQELPRTAPSQQSMCYIVRNHARRGKVDAAAVKRLGVAKTDIRKLVAGESVTSATDGQTVTPDMVMGATIAGAGFAVVDLPTRAYVADFVARPEWSSAAVVAGINTMFWLVGAGVTADPRVQAFMAAHASMRHVVAAPDTCANRLALSSPAAMHIRHHRVDPDRFPLQQYNNIPSAPPPPPAAEGRGKPAYQAARPGWSIRLAPQVVEEDGKVQPLVDYAAALREMDGTALALADAARQQVAEATFVAAETASRQRLGANAEVEVIPLGTGSAAPSKYRNVSATLVRVPGQGSYLFDCGENTLGSLRRMLGAAGLAAELRALRCLWISHLHADHHLGTASLLRAWRDATAATEQDASRRLAVASHVNMLHWLREYADIEDFGLERLRLVELHNRASSPQRQPAGGRICEAVVFGAAEAAEFGLQRIDACFVNHCFGALATVFALAGGDHVTPLKVAYSGDCRPSDDFVALGQGAALLIHESTFDDELAGEAKGKRHCTMGEALDVARRMRARRVLLTHFSQRYPKIPVFGAHGDSSSADEMQVLVAFDQMRVRLGDFRTAAAYLPALQKLYEERGEGLD